MLLLEIFLKPSCSFWTWMVSILPPHRRIKGLPNGKGSSKVWKEKGWKWFCHFFLCLPFLFLFLHYFCVFLSCFEWIEFYALLCLTCFCLFTFQFCFILFFPYKIKKKIAKSEKYKNSMCSCTMVLVYLGWPLKQNFLNFVSFLI